MILKKQIIVIATSILVLVGCSAKYPNMKKGAIIGGLTAVVGTVALGTQDTNSDAAPLIATIAIIMGLAGTSLGAGIGYIFDNLQDNDDKIQEMIQSHRIEETR